MAISNDSSASGGHTPAELPDFNLTAGWHQLPDGPLQTLVDQSRYIGVGVTLFMPWGIAAGTIVPGEKFFDVAATKLREATALDPNEEVRKYADELGQNMYGFVADGLRKSAEDDGIHQGVLTTCFIHLEDTTCHIGGRNVKFDYLRLQLSHVTGWTYGLRTF
ncbi:hypothetical protein [Nocardia sp. NPDC052566]|uniref:hypothetical protein n=1 Tax=Nocardia sp. NPDC052566 TaxID=3364330 RepID=UPI0037C9001E